MNKAWSTHWKASKQPRKQRKYQYHLPLHLVRKTLSSPLAAELRKKYNKRNITIHKGDTVKIMRGQFKGKTGKIDSILTHDRRVHVEGITLIKKDGTKIPYAIHPSKIRIIELITDDKKRLETLQRK